jgi:hypothetical protein
MDVLMILIVIPTLACVVDWVVPSSLKWEDVTHNHGRQLQGNYSLQDSAVLYQLLQRSYRIILLFLYDV